MARLRLLTPMPELAQKFPLVAQMVRIGREVDNDIVLPHPTVSRYHAVIHLNREGIRIEDRGSSNGTYHNGEKVERAWLVPGDRLFIGRLEFRLEDEQAEQGGNVRMVKPSAPLTQPDQPSQGKVDRKVLLVGGVCAVVILACLAWLLFSPSKKPLPGKKSVSVHSGK